MKTIAQLLANIDAITDEFSSVPEKDNKAAFIKAERKYLREIVKAERALATYEPQTAAEFVEKVMALLTLMDVDEAFDSRPAMKAWKAVMPRDLAVLSANSPRLRKAA